MAGNQRVRNPGEISNPPAWIRTDNSKFYTGYFLADERQDSLCEIANPIYIGEVIHPAKKYDRRATTARIPGWQKIRSVHSVWNQGAGCRHLKSLKLILLALTGHRAVVKTLCDVSLVISKLLRFQPVYPGKRELFPLRVISPFRRIKVAKIHDPESGVKIHYVLSH